MAGETSEVERLAARCRCVQVNALDYGRTAMARLAVTLGREVIMQLRELPPETVDERITGLWDRSGGRGIAAIGEWPTTPAGLRMGYAGGLGPSNIAEAVRRVREIGGTVTWLDTESGVRTNDRFDLEKVEAMIAAAEAA